jgi:hypothetical protein
MCVDCLPADVERLRNLADIASTAEKLQDFQFAISQVLQRFR